MKPRLVMYDDDTDPFWASGAESRGPSEPILKYVKGVLDMTGYEGEKITLKTGQESSIIAPKLESPVRASKSNGKMEHAVGRWRGQLQTINHYVVKRLGRIIEVDGILFGWLIPYVTEILNKFSVGPNGRTAYERITGHKGCHVAIGCAESVEFMLETDKSKQHKADARMMSGTFPGYI